MGSEWTHGSDCSRRVRLLRCSVSTLRRSRGGRQPAGSTASGHRADTDGSSSPRFGRCFSSCPARASDRERTPSAIRPVVGGHSATHDDRSGRRVPTGPDPDRHRAVGLTRPAAVPPKVGEVIELLEPDGRRRLARTTGSHRRPRIQSSVARPRSPVPAPRFRRRHHARRRGPIDGTQTPSRPTRGGLGKYHHRPPYPAAEGW